MKLSAQIIVHHLRRKYRLSASSWLSAEPHLEYPLVWDNHSPLKEGRIYIAGTENFELPSCRLSRILIILMGGPCPAPLMDAPNLCILEESPSSWDVLTFLQEIFFRYNDWNQQILGLMLTHPSVQKILDLAETVIPNPMMVIGLDFTIVAARDHSYGRLHDSILGSTEETHALISSLKHDLNYSEALSHTGYFLYPGNQLAPPSLCVNIFPSEKSAYRLLIFSGELPLDDTIGFLAEHLASLISHVLSVKSAPQRSVGYPLHQIFHTLLTNPKADYVEISRQLTENQWLSSHTYQCVLLKTGISDQKNMTLKSICSYVENSIPASCAVEHRGDIVIYINLDLCSLTLDQCSQRLAAFVRDSLLIAGYSRKMLGHFNFHRQYVQAFASIQTGSRKNPTAWIHHFNDIALPYILEQATRSLPAYMICHERLLQLKYLDKDSGSQLLSTLRCYLENQQSATKTAAALFIHRSTLLYRLEKIQKILRADLGNPDELLYLTLSFYLMDQEDQAKR